MREIIFRGKTIAGKWVKGYYVYDKLYNAHLMYVNEETGGDGYVDPEYWCTNYEVIPETVGQFTGLKDKNGVKIFEHDKIKANYKTGSVHDIYGDVLYHNGMIQIEHDGKNYYKINTKKKVPFRKLFNIEVIGNIHDKEDI